MSDLEMMILIQGPLYLLMIAQTAGLYWDYRDKKEED
jgi:hypothetical protein